MRLKKPVIAVSAVALLTLAACGGSGDSGGPGEAQSSLAESGAAGSGKDPNREAPAAPIDGAQEGGTVKVISVAGLNTMDPSEVYYSNSISIMSNLVTRQLTQYVYDPETKDMVLIPDLATDLGTPNDDFTEWEFTIRDGAKWENGTEITADDIAFGIKRSFDRETFPEGPLYSNQYFLDGETYEGPYKPGDDYDGVVVDGNKLTIKMSKPFPDMPYWGAFPAMGPIPSGAASDPAKYRLHPWSSGPYKFDQYTPEKSLTLVKNDQWDPDTDPGRHQYPDSYDMKFDVPTAKIDQVLLKDQGEAKNTLSYDNVQVANYLPFKEQAEDRLVLGTVPCTRFWAPDYRKITDRKVREALAWAYPYADVYTASGFIPNVTRAYGTNLMPPGVPGREEFNPLPDHEPGSTDPAVAKQLLTDAGAEGYEIKFLYAADDPSLVDAKDAIVQGLEKAGFKATPVATTVANLSTDRADPDSKINVRDAGWCSDWPSGSSWLPPNYQTTNLKKEGLAANYAVFSEKAVDDQINSIQRAPIEDQPGLWNDLDQSVAEDYFPLFVTGYYGAAMMRGSNVQGFLNDAIAGEMPTWKDIWLKQ
jgi:peptide/nickel transport system substrate-binding protein